MQIVDVLGTKEESVAQVVFQFGECAMGWIGFGKAYVAPVLDW